MPSIKKTSEILTPPPPRRGKPCQQPSPHGTPSTVIPTTHTSTHHAHVYPLPSHLTLTVTPTPTPSPGRGVAPPSPRSSRRCARSLPSTEGRTMAAGADAPTSSLSPHGHSEPCSARRTRASVGCYSPLCTLPTVSGVEGVAGDARAASEEAGHSLGIVWPLGDALAALGSTPGRFVERSPHGPSPASRGEGRVVVMV